MNILLVSPYFPPFNAIGALRAGKLAKHFMAQGHEVRVIAAETSYLSRTIPLETPEESVQRCKIYSPDMLWGNWRQNWQSLFGSQPSSAKTTLLAKTVRALAGIYRTFFCFPDRYFGWIPPALLASRRICANWKPDIVYATAQPYSALVVGRAIARRHDAAFVAEFRDLWSDNHYLDAPEWRARIDAWLEDRVVEDADLVVSVSDVLSEKLRVRHRRPTKTIFNGFDPDDFPEHVAPDPSVFEIVYTGSVYAGRRDPTSLFRVLNELGDKASHVRVRFFGRNLDIVRELASKAGVSHLVEVGGEIPYREALERQCAADALLLLLWDTPAEKGVLTGKIFEYLASRRPIVLLGGQDGSAADLIRERQAGHVASGKEDLEQYLLSLLSQQAAGGVPRLARTVTHGFSRSEQFAELTTTLERVAERAKVCIVTRKLDVGGTELQIAQLVEAIDRERFDVEVFAIFGDGALEEKVRELGVRVITPTRRREAIARIEGAFRLFLKMRHERSTIFHFWLPEAYLIGGLCGWLLDHQRMIMSRRSLNQYQEKHPFLRRLEHALHGKMQTILGNSNIIARELEGEGVVSDRIQVIRNGLDLDHLRPRVSASQIRSELGIEQDSILLISVANLIEYKGHHDLVEAMAYTKQQFDGELVLLCVGRDDGRQMALEAQVDSLGLGASVQFLGSRRDVGDLLNAADIGVVPSWQEGFSNSLMEAMAAGLPVVATAVGGNVEAIVDGETGLLVPPREPRVLSVEILRLVSDEALRHSIGRAAAQYARSAYDLPSCMRQYEDLYRSITSKRVEA